MAPPSTGPDPANTPRQERGGWLRALPVPALLSVALVAGVVAAQQDEDASDAPRSRWWRGNTHTHTLWSDGDAPPDFVAKQYSDAGYDFLVLSDHNVLSRGERWFPVQEDGRLTPARLETIRAAVGGEFLETRTGEEGLELKLATLADVRKQFEAPGRFLLIEGEEITDSFEGRPVHVNGLNLAEKIAPQGGTSYLETVQRNVDAVRAQGERLDRPTLAHLNHPNFGWAVRGTADLVGLQGEGFLEVYNGHPSTREAGDEAHLSVEDLWDQVNVGRGLMGLPLLLGFATDDTHHHFEEAPRLANSRRGWVMVRAPRLEPDAILAALQAGDFYATSGVLLEDLRLEDGRLTVDVDTREGVTYETVFIGGVLDAEGAWTVQALHRTTEDPAVYAVQGHELFVRATVTSSRLHPRPQDDAPGAAETVKAWTQPQKVRR